jgi:hypothetical protein
VLVEPYRAILETDYFIKCIEMCEEKRDAEIKRVESGIEDTKVVEETGKTEKTDVEKNTEEWNKLQ